MKKELLSEKIRKLADSIGIDALGFAEASEFSDYGLRDSKRRDPKLSLPSAKTIIVAGIYIGAVTLPAWTNPWYGRTSRLYLSEFFLDVVKPLEPMVKLLKNEGYQAIVCDGSKKEGSILPLKLAAIRAGLGWQGKHSLLISKKYGTFQKRIEDWENFFYLPDLVELSENGYREKLGYLNTGIPYNLFHRNVLIAMERAKKEVA
jgi:hypothetical protein